MIWLCVFKRRRIAYGTATFKPISLLRCSKALRIDIILAIRRHIPVSIRSPDALKQLISQLDGPVASMPFPRTIRLILCATVPDLSRIHTAGWAWYGSRAYRSKCHDILNQAFECNAKNWAPVLHVLPAQSYRSRMILDIAKLIPKFWQYRVTAIETFAQWLATREYIKTGGQRKVTADGPDGPARLLFPHTLGGANIEPRKDMARLSYENLVACQASSGGQGSSVRLRSRQTMG
jgi:hypothetical protein